MTAHPRAVGGGGDGAGRRRGGVKKKEEQRSNTNTTKEDQKEENLRCVVWRNRYCNRSTKRNEKREGNYSSELMITT